MRLQQYYLLFFLAISFLPSSCTSQKKAMIYDQHNHNINVEKGESFGIELPTHQGTGFVWQIKGELDTEYLEFIKQEYRELGDEQLDIPGLDYFEFKALKKGETQVFLWYIRPWKKDNETNPDIKTAVFEIAVQ